MGMDLITLEVLRNKFDVIADEMEITLLKSVYSSIVKEGMDASAALFTTGGETIAQAASIPIHLGSLVPAVQRILQEFPAEAMAEGDVYIMNDPYDGGSHLPDIVIVVPILYQGRPVGLSTTMSHNQDVGGKTPGSVPTDATEIFQEGLRLPPLKFYERGVPNHTLHAILQKNVRIPDVLMGDLHGQVAAGNVGKQRFIALLETYGVEVVLGAIEELMDRAETMTRARLHEIPDGSYTFTDYLDNDGVDLDRRIPIQATVTIKGSDMYCDFTGTSPQVRGPLNCGCYRSVHLHLPAGTVVNPRPPAAVNARTATIIRIADVLHGALVQAMPGKLPAAPSGQLLVASFGGIDPRSGASYVTSELGAGGVGARPSKDGVDVMEMGPSNCMNIPVEAIEMRYPLRIRQYSLRNDSGGAGRYRGGLGATKVFEATSGDVVVSIRGERYFTQPWGLAGGRPAASAQAWVERADGSIEEIPSKRVLTLHQDESLHVDTPGGGGYGDPLERDPEAVQQDVCDRRVTVLMARQQYGVVLQEPTLVVDQEATQCLRRALRAQRVEA